jgi:hypothetical protein
MGPSAKVIFPDFPILPDLEVEMRKLFVLTVFLIAAGAANAQKVVPGLSFQLEPSNGSGNFCLDAASNTAHEGNKVQLWQCHGAPNQRWTITTSSNDKEHAIIGIGGYCLDVRSGGTQLGTPVQLFHCHFQQNQRFTLLPDGHIMEPVSGRCLLAPPPQNGASVSLDTCKDIAGEIWNTVP